MTTAFGVTEVTGRKSNAQLEVFKLGIVVLAIELTATVVVMLVFTAAKLCRLSVKNCDHNNKPFHVHIIRIHVSS